MEHLFGAEKMPQFFCAFIVVEGGGWQWETAQIWTYQVEAPFPFPGKTLGSPSKSVAGSDGALLSPASMQGEA
jgi:hypothetical protein